MRMRPLPIVLLGLLAVAVLAPSAAAEKPHFEVAVATNSRDSLDEHSVLGIETPKVYVVYMLDAAPRGARLKAVWWVEKAEGLTANTKIDQAETQARGGAYMGAFSYPRPAKGWPVGSYRVDLFVEDRLDKSVHFEIARK